MLQMRFMMEARKKGKEIAPSQPSSLSSSTPYEEVIQFPVATHRAADASDEVKGFELEEAHKENIQERHHYREMQLERVTKNALFRSSKGGKRKNYVKKSNGVRGKKGKGMEVASEKGIDNNGEREHNKVAQDRAKDNFENGGGEGFIEQELRILQERMARARNQAVEKVQSTLRNHPGAQSLSLSLSHTHTTSYPSLRELKERKTEVKANHRLLLASPQNSGFVSRGSREEECENDERGISCDEDKRERERDGESGCLTTSHLRTTSSTTIPTTTQEKAEMASTPQSVERPFSIQRINEVEGIEHERRKRDTGEREKRENTRFDQSLPSTSYLRWGEVSCGNSTRSDTCQAAHPTPASIPSPSFPSSFFPSNSSKMISSKITGNPPSSYPLQMSFAGPSSTHSTSLPSSCSLMHPPPSLPTFLGLTNHNTYRQSRSESNGTSTSGAEGGGKGMNKSVRQRESERESSNRGETQSVGRMDCKKTECSVDVLSTLARQGASVAGMKLAAQRVKAVRSKQKNATREAEDTKKRREERLRKVMLSAKEMRLRSAETSKRRKSSSSSPSNHTRSQQKIHLKDGMRVAKERKRDRAKEGVEMKKGMSGNKETVLSAQLRAKKRVQEKKKEMRMKKEFERAQKQAKANELFEKRNNRIELFLVRQKAKAHQQQKLTRDVIKAQAARTERRGTKPTRMSESKEGNDLHHERPVQNRFGFRCTASTATATAADTAIPTRPSLSDPISSLCPGGSLRKTTKRVRPQLRLGSPSTEQHLSNDFHNLKENEGSNQANAPPPLPLPLPSPFHSGAARLLERGLEGEKREARLFRILEESLQQQEEKKENRNDHDLRRQSEEEEPNGNERCQRQEPNAEHGEEESDRAKSKAHVPIDSPLIHFTPPKKKEVDSPLITFCGTSRNETSRDKQEGMVVNDSRQGQRWERSLQSYLPPPTSSPFISFSPSTPADRTPTSTPSLSSRGKMEQGKTENENQKQRANTPITPLIHFQPSASSPLITFSALKKVEKIPLAEDLAAPLRSFSSKEVDKAVEAEKEEDVGEEGLYSEDENDAGVVVTEETSAERHQHQEVTAKNGTMETIDPFRTRSKLARSPV